MPQLYQHEILFRAHDAIGHQGITKVVACIQERHTGPGIRRSVGQNVNQCLTCQQVRDKPGDVRFHLKNIQSGHFNDMVHYDYLKICPSGNGNTGILVIINHLSEVTDAVLCSHVYDAITPLGCFWPRSPTSSRRPCRSPKLLQLLVILVLKD